MVIIVLFSIVFSSVGSPIGSVQDISPPSTPSNSVVSSLSPYINSSAVVNNVASPHILASSPGITSAQSNYQPSHQTPPPSVQQIYYRYPQYETKSQPGVSGSLAAQNVSTSSYVASQSSTQSTMVTSPTPALHPLQQAMLLQQQQQQQMVVGSSACE